MSQPSTKVTASARFIKLLFHHEPERKMRLIEHTSRCIRRGEIHEIVTTNQPQLSPGDTVDRVGFLGFAEFDTAGVLDRGDCVLLNGLPIGTIAGFDDCHFPNHYNVVIEAAALMSAREVGAQLGSELRFKPPPPLLSTSRE